MAEEVDVSNFRSSILVAVLLKLLGALFQLVHVDRGRVAGEHCEFLESLYEHSDISQTFLVVELLLPVHRVCVWALDSVRDRSVCGRWFLQCANASLALLLRSV